MCVLKTHIKLSIFRNIILSDSNRTTALWTACHIVHIPHWPRFSTNLKTNKLQESESKYRILEIRSSLLYSHLSFHNIIALSEKIIKSIKSLLN